MVGFRHGTFNCISAVLGLGMLCCFVGGVRNTFCRGARSPCASYGKIFRRMGNFLTRANGGVLMAAAFFGG